MMAEMAPLIAYPDFPIVVSCLYLPSRVARKLEETAACVKEVFKNSGKLW